MRALVFNDHGMKLARQTHNRNHGQQGMNQ
ncbi:Uncharacterised protein [Vibrio cholerae]|nr:Uncharacterised protein [Vibrio cholerae]